MKDHRRDLVSEYRKSRRRVHWLRCRIKWLSNLLSLAEEQSADIEESLAQQLLRLGPIDLDGRRYEAEKRHGLRVVKCSPIDAYLMREVS